MRGFIIGCLIFFSLFVGISYPCTPINNLSFRSVDLCNLGNHDFLYGASVGTCPSYETGGRYYGSGQYGTVGDAYCDGVHAVWCGLKLHIVVPSSSDSCGPSNQADAFCSNQNTPCSGTAYADGFVAGSASSVTHSAETSLAECSLGFSGWPGGDVATMSDGCWLSYYDWYSYYITDHFDVCSSSIPSRSGNVCSYSVTCTRYAVVGASYHTDFHPVSDQSQQCIPAACPSAMHRDCNTCGDVCSCDISDNPCPTCYLAGVNSNGCYTGACTAPGTCGAGQHSRTDSSSGCNTGVCCDNGPGSCDTGYTLALDHDNCFLGCKKRGSIIHGRSVDSGAGVRSNWGRGRSGREFDYE